jgi:outer membrane protein assembly factor BamB
VLIRSAATTAQWTQFHGNAARTGRASYPGPGVAKLAWKTGVGCHHWGPGCWLPMFTGTDSSPAISQDGSMAYIGSYDHHLYAVEVMSGKVVWRTELGSKGIGIESSPAVGLDNRVVVGSYDHAVWCVNGTNGTVLWRFETAGDVASAPAVSDDGTTAFVGGVDGFLYALAMATGAVQWRYNASANASNYQAIWAPPAVVAGRVYFGSGGEANPYTDMHARVHAVDEATVSLCGARRSGPRSSRAPPWMPRG